MPDRLAELEEKNIELLRLNRSMAESLQRRLDKEPDEEFVTVKVATKWRADAVAKVAAVLRDMVEEAEGRFYEMEAPADRWASMHAGRAMLKELRIGPSWSTN